MPLDAIATDLAWLTFVVFTVATMLTHNTAVFLPLAANLFVLGLMVVQRLRRAGAPPSLQAPSLGNWVKAQIAVFVLWSPWLVFFVRQTRSCALLIPAPTWDGVVQVVKTLLYPSAPLPTGQATVIWILYGVVLCLGVLHFRKQLARLAFLVTLFAVPFLGELLVSIRRPIFYDRTLIWTTIPLFLLLGAGIAQLRFRFLTIAVGILATFSSCCGRLLPILPERGLEHGGRVRGQVRRRGRSGAVQLQLRGDSVQLLFQSVRGSLSHPAEKQGCRRTC
ncbi:MAG: hypothetical protein R2854_11840 [Caldilineaceae bacterium]